jgi:hypothetical protein
MYTTTILEPHQGLDLKISYLYEVGTPGNNDTPGTPEHANIQKIEYNGQDITKFALALYDEDELVDRIIRVNNSCGGYDE